MRIPLGKFVAVTGVCGSGKSTLVVEVLYKKLAQLMYRAKDRPGAHDADRGHRAHRQGDRHRPEPHRPHAAQQPGHLRGPLHRHPRPVRHPARSRRRAATRPAASRFNVKGGRCEACQGDGIIRIEMQFLPDVYVPCEECKGNRYNRETLEIQFRGKSIADVLEMTVEEGLEFFQNIPRIRNKLETLNAVGLGYVRLGQPATTLSGGEAQRIKLSKELSRRATGQHALHPGRADHRPPLRGCAQAAGGAPRAGQQGQHRVGHRAQPGRDQERATGSSTWGPKAAPRAATWWPRARRNILREMPKSYTGQFLRPMVYEENYTPATA